MGAPTRAEMLVVGGINVPVPTFFPAISSVKSNAHPLDDLTVIRGVKYPQFLISAHDIYYAGGSRRRAIDSILRDAVRAGQIVLLDSGNYEAFWRERSKWWSVRRLADVLRTSPFHLAFAFDDLNPKGARARIVRGIEFAVAREQRMARHGTVIPIIHSQRDWLPVVTKEVGRRLTPIVIGVAERELGDGLFERAATVVRIRRGLNALGYYCHLHLLGTGNPISMLVYAICGADCFDGLEWCQTTVDYRTARLHHFAQWDLFADQSGLDLRRMPYRARVLIHNLGFYADWVDRMRWAIRAKQWAELLEQYVPKTIVSRVKKVVADGR